MKGKVCREGVANTNQAGKGGVIIPARTVFLAGHALLPQASTAQSVYRDLVITVEIEPKYSVIVRASCNLVTELGRDYLSRLLVGRSLQAGVEEIIGEVQDIYHGAVQNAIIAALRDLARRYEAWRQLGGGLSAEHVGQA